MDVNLVKAYLPSLLRFLGSTEGTGSAATRAASQAAAADQQRELLTSIGSGTAATATFSALGSRLNTLSQAIKATGDPDVLAGFQTALDGILSGSDPAQTIGLINGMADLSETDAGSFRAAFSTLNRLTEAGLGNATSLYTEALSGLSAAYGSAGVDSLTSSVNAVLDADYSASEVTAGDNLASLFAGYSTFLQTGADSPTAATFFDRLATGLGSATTGNEIAAFFQTGAD